MGYNGYDYHKTKQQVFSKEFIYMDAPKLLFSIWMIWIPMVTLIYSLPSSVQIPFWSIIMIGSALVFQSQNVQSEHETETETDINSINIM